MAKKQEKEKYKLLFWLFSLPDLMESLFRKYPADSTISSFCRKLRRYGFRYIRDGKDYRYFCQQHPKETRDLVLEYYDNAINYYDKEELLGCLYSKEHLDLFDFLICELRKHAYLKSNYYGIVVGSGSYFYHVFDKTLEDEYIRIFTDNKLPFIVRSEVSRALVKLQPQGIQSYMLDIVKDENHPFVHIALEYFSKHKDVEQYKEIFEQYKKDDDEEIRKYARAGLKKYKLKRKINLKWDRYS